MNTKQSFYRQGLMIGSLTLAVTLAACGPQNGAAVTPEAPATPAQPAAQVASPAPAPAPVVAAPQVASAHLGEVRSIDPIRDRPQGTGTGAVLGGVLGAVVGNQFGGGHGRQATTVLGAVGGAVAGNNIERNRNEQTVGYRVNVRLDNGESRTFEQGQLDGLRVGDRVRVDAGQVHRV